MVDLFQKSEVDVCEQLVDSVSVHTVGEWRVGACSKGFDSELPA